MGSETGCQCAGGKNAIWSPAANNSIIRSILGGKSSFRSPTFRYSAARNPFDRQQDNNSIFGGRNVKCINCERQHFDPWPIGGKLDQLDQIPNFGHWPIGKLAAKVHFHFGGQRANNSIRGKSKFNVLAANDNDSAIRSLAALVSQRIRFRS